jgi:peroxiredoxin
MTRKTARLTALFVAAVLPPPAALTEMKQPWIGEPAPAFSLSTLGAKKLSLADLKGKLVVLHFGAGWWPFCNAEAPHLETLWAKYKDRGVQVVVIDVEETSEKTKEYAKRFKFSFPVLRDADGSVSKSYAPAGAQPDLPRDQVPIASNLIIDRAGKIRFYSLLDTTSFDAKLADLTARLEALLSAE